MAKDKILVAVSVESIEHQPYLSPDGRLLKSAVIEATSQQRDWSFKLRTGLLSPEQQRLIELLKEHGFTAVELPADAHFWDKASGEWKNQVIVSAMERISKVPIGCEIDDYGYDDSLANLILRALQLAFPVAKDTIWLKNQLNPEPSDAKMYRAIDALEKRKLVTGNIVRTGIDQVIRAIYDIQITERGLDYLEGKNERPLPVAATIHGDQIINYGHAGVIGRQSITVSNSQLWSTIAQIEFSKLSAELEQLKAELRKAADTPEDFQQLALIAEAKKYADQADGSKVVEVLSKAGKELYSFAKDVGTEVTAKVISKALGLEK